MRHEEETPEGRRVCLRRAEQAMTEAASLISFAASMLRRAGQYETADALVALHKTAKDGRRSVTEKMRQV